LDSEDIEFYTLGYHKKTLDDYKGKPVILHFWATWCAPCVEELPEVDKTQAAYSDKLTIITLSEDIKRSLVTDFYRDHNINHLTMFFDKRMKLLTKLGGRALPASLFYDKNHRLVKRIDRTVDWELEETKALLDSLVR
jgi:thiol-disulfide isomerase/thioredoxin